MPSCAYMALNKEQFSRRLRAARMLRGEGVNDRSVPLAFPRADLGKAVKAKRGNAGLNHPALIERLEMEAADAHIEAFTEALGMPKGWFTEPDLDKVLGVQAEGSPAAGEGATAESELDADFEQAAEHSDEQAGADAQKPGVHRAPGPER